MLRSQKILTLEMDASSARLQRACHRLTREREQFREQQAVLRGSARARARALVALRHGTVNFGLPLLASLAVQPGGLASLGPRLLVGAGLIATPHGAVCGRATTGIEPERVEEGLELL